MGVIALTVASVVACGDAFSSDCLETRTCPRSRGDAGASAAGDGTGENGGAGIAAGIGGDSDVAGAPAAPAGAGGESAVAGVAGAGGENADGPVCGDGLVTGAEAMSAGCDDGNLQSGDGCSDTCTVEDGWTCDANAPSKCTSVCGDGLVVGQEALAGGCDDAATAAGDGCDDECKVEPGYVCQDQPSTCAKTCGNGKLDAGETCEDGNQATDDGCSACTVEKGYTCDNATLPSKCADIDECKPGGGNNCSANATCTNTDGSFTCKCKPGYSGNGVSCDEIDECKDKTDDCDANATCTNTAGSFSCACKNGYWGTGVSCTPNPSITSFTADYSRVCSGGAVTFSATYKNGTGAIDHSVGSIVSGKTAVSGAIAASTVFKLTVSAAGGTPATAQLTVDTIAHGTFALTKNPSGIVGPLSDAQLVKLKDGRILIFGSSPTTGLGSAQIFDPHNESFTATTLTSGLYPTIAALNDGRVLVTMGDGSTTANVYNPVSNTSVATGGTMIQPRFLSPGLTLASGKVLMPGVLLYDEGGGTISLLKSSEIYDPSAAVNGSFIAGPDMNVAHHHGGIARLPGAQKILLAGGCSSIAGDGNCTALTTSGDLYDPTVGKAGAFLKTGVMSAARMAPISAALADDRVLIAGGFPNLDPGDKTTVKTAELYDPQGGDPQNGIFGAFQATGSMVTARSYATATLLKSGKLLIAGGWSGTTSLKASELYDPQSGKFTSTGDLNHARALHQAVLLDNGMVIIGPDATELYCQ